MESEERKWEKLEQLLHEKDEWPTVYLFKFIVKNNEEKINEVKAHFEEGEITLNYSKNGNYVSVSIKEMMIEPSAVIHRYKQVGKIEGVLSL